MEFILLFTLFSLTQAIELCFHQDLDLQVFVCFDFNHILFAFSFEILLNSCLIIDRHLEFYYPDLLTAIAIYLNFNEFKIQ